MVFVVFIDVFILPFVISFIHSPENIKVLLLTDFVAVADVFELFVLFFEGSDVGVSIFFTGSTG